MTPNGLNQPSAKQQVVSLLRDFASQLQKMDDSELESVLAGEFRLEIRPPQKKSKKQPTRNRYLDEEFEKLQDTLRNTDTREQAREIIDSILHTKEELTRFARVLDIPVPKSISSEQIKDRSVEGTATSFSWGLRRRPCAGRRTSHRLP